MFTFFILNNTSNLNPEKEKGNRFKGQGHKNDMSWIL